MYCKEREHDLVLPRTDCNDVSPFTFYIVRSTSTDPAAINEGAAAAQVPRIKLQLLHQLHSSLYTR